MKNKVLLKTFGCQMNKLDTMLVTAALEKAGFHLTDSLKETDVVLINTCSVRQHAEEKVFSHLGHLGHLKENRPGIVVGVIGCMAQRLGRELLKHKAVDVVCGPAQIPQLADLINKSLQQKQKSVAITAQIRRKVSDKQSQALEEFESVYDTDSKQLPNQAFVRVMQGCNKFCTYCIVPYVRGPEVSRPPKRIIEQIKKLAGRGIKLITLLGQAVNSYSYTAGERTYCLADLLYMAGEVEGIEWIRFVTSYPTEKFFDRICQAMADLPKVCKYLHIPAQSGSDKILKAMNRRYTAAQYLDLLERAKSVVRGIAVAGDFIVGFPGETQEDFQATVELVKKARYKNCFIFKYSPRPHTTAERRLPDDIPMEIKRRRNIELLAVQEKISDELSGQFLNKQVRVLVEGLSKKPHLNAGGETDLPQLVGRTAQDWIVVFNGPAESAGGFADIRITKASPLTLFGERVEISRSE
jgi:tRNA-2-methylthio-N6-dimethylallyladenosine synthase